MLEGKKAAPKLQQVLRSLLSSVLGKTQVQEVLDHTDLGKGSEQAGKKDWLGMNLLRKEIG